LPGTTSLDDLYNNVADKEEIASLALYSQIKGKEPIALIDEKLLGYY
jgi:8-oxo-dGTP diphosphatase